MLLMRSRLPPFRIHNLSPKVGNPVRSRRSHASSPVHCLGTPVSLPRWSVPTVTITMRSDSQPSPNPSRAIEFGEQSCVTITCASHEDYRLSRRTTQTSHRELRRGSAADVARIWFAPWPYRASRVTLFAMQRARYLLVLFEHGSVAAANCFSSSHICGCCAAASNNLAQLDFGFADHRIPSPGLAVKGDSASRARSSGLRQDLKSHVLALLMRAIQTTRRGQVDPQWRCGMDRKQQLIYLRDCADLAQRIAPAVRAAINGHRSDHEFWWRESDKVALPPLAPLRELCRLLVAARHPESAAIEAFITAAENFEWYRRVGRRRASWALNGSMPVGPLAETADRMSAFATAVLTSRLLTLL